MIFSWVGLTLFASFMQAWRNAFQKQLSGTVDVYGVTFARFIFALPLAIAYLTLLYHMEPVKAQVTFTNRYWLAVMIVAVGQIVATALMVRLFKQKNYAIGVGLSKSEAVLAAIIAVVFLSDSLSLLAWFGVMIGALAIFLLSKGPKGTTLSWSSALIGLGSGLGFAIASLFVREASLELTTLPYLHRAAWVLVSVIGVQCVLLIVYLACFRRHTLVLMYQRVSLVLKVSVCSFLASMGWFSAMSMQSVALVKTLGQMEVVFTMLISVFFFKEKLAKTDHMGLVLVVLAAILVIWA